jgi:hypothetical protein
MVTDVELNVTNPSIENDPPDFTDPFLQMVVQWHRPAMPP